MRKPPGRRLTPTRHRDSITHDAAGLRGFSFGEIARMSEHESRGHHRDHHAASQHGENRGWWRQAHKDWRVWTVVALMLLAMVIYVMTMDEAIQPGGKVNQPVPAAAGP